MSETLKFARLAGSNMRTSEPGFLMRRSFKCFGLQAPSRTHGGKSGADRSWVNGTKSNKGLGRIT
jgi:hypothetical protein